MVNTGIFSLLLVLCGHAQLKKFYSLHDDSLFDTVNFTLHATSGHSYFRSVPSQNALNIYGNPDLERINPSFDAKVVGKACNVNLNLNEYRTSGLGDGLAFAVLSDASREDESNYWKMLVSDSKVYNLDLFYGIGTSDIDLSGTAINHLKVTTGSAEVKLNYDRMRPNTISMDTLMVKADLGTLTAEDLYQSRAEHIIANIGFGKVALDFTRPMNNKCLVEATVGAGQLKVLLPRDAPVIIYINESPLCGVTIARDFEEVEKNVFVNMNYAAEAENLLTLEIDVAMGNAMLVYAERR